MATRLTNPECHSKPRLVATGAPGLLVDYGPSCYTALPIDQDRKYVEALWLG